MIEDLHESRSYLSVSTLTLTNSGDRRFWFVPYKQSNSTAGVSVAIFPIAKIINTCLCPETMYRELNRPVLFN